MFLVENPPAPFIYVITLWAPNCFSHRGPHSRSAATALYHCWKPIFCICRYRHVTPLNAQPSQLPQNEQYPIIYVLRSLISKSAILVMCDSVNYVFAPMHLLWHGWCRAGILLRHYRMSHHAQNHCR